MVIPLVTIRNTDHHPLLFNLGDDVLHLQIKPNFRTYLKALDRAQTLFDNPMVPDLVISFQRRLLELCPHLGLQPAQAVLLPVDEFSRLGQRRMDGLNFAPNLLADEAVVRMALRHGAELAHVERFAQVHFHVPADFVGERHDVLRFVRQIGVNSVV